MPILLVGLLRASAFLTALFSIATLFNPLHDWLELFSHFRLQYLVCAALLAVVLAALRQRNWAIAMALLTLFNIAPVAAWYLPSNVNENPGPTRFKIMQANVLGHDNDPTSVLAHINAEQPDIIFLQEINDEWVEALMSVESRYPYHVAVPRHDNFGIAVYSRTPFVNVEIIESPPEGFPSLRVRQDIKGQDVTFVSTHPLPPIGSEWAKGRNLQLASIADLLASTTGARVLVGDLNISMWAHHYKALEEISGMRNTRLGFGVVPTWPRQLFFAAIPIDHCLVSDEFAVLDTRSGPANGSDHLPLIVELAL